MYIRYPTSYCWELGEDVNHFGVRDDNQEEK